MMGINKYRPTISDADFDRLLIQLEVDRSYYADFKRHRFTPDQVIKLCTVVSKWLTINILADQYIPPSGVDILIDSDHESDRWFLLENDVPMSSEQVGRLLSDPEAYIRNEACTHPNCTDSQKVAYHLKWGE